MQFLSTPRLRIALAIFLAALLVRTSFILAHPRPLFSDEKDYHALASSLASTGEYSRDGVPTGYRPVGYPLLLSLLYRIYDRSIILARLLQAFLDSLTAFFLVLLAGQSERGGLAAGILWSLFPPAILYTNMLLPETVSAFMLILLAIVFTSSTEKPALFLFVFTGAVAGILVLTKPFVFLVVLLLVVFHRLFHLARFQIILFTTFVLLVILPWAFRNSSTMHEFSLSTNGGLNLYIGNNPNATGAYSAHLPAELTDSTLSEAALDARSSDLAVQFIKSNPAQFALNGFKKIAHVFRGEAELAVLAFHPNPTDRQSSFADKYRSLPFFLPLILTIPYCIVVLLALLKLISGRSDRLFFFFVMLLTASLLVVHFLFFGGSRFHFLLMPFAVLFASESLVTLRSTLRSLHRPKAILLAIVSCGLCTIWIYEFAYLAQP